MQKKAFTLIFSWAYNVSTILHYLHQVSANVSDRAKKITRGAFRLLYWDKGGWEIKGREIVTAAFMFSRDRNQFRPCAVWTHATAFCDIVVLFLINLRLQIYVWRFFFAKFRTDRFMSKWPASTSFKILWKGERCKVHATHSIMSIFTCLLMMGEIRCSPPHYVYLSYLFI